METALANGLGIQVFKTYHSMSKQAADLVYTELKRRPDLLLCVSAGGTPTRTYEFLAGASIRNRALFKRMRLLQIDEWSGLRRNDPGTCYSDLYRKLLAPLDVGPNRFMGFRADSLEPEAECRRVARWLAANGRIDICLLGMGTNGHVAMNEPTATMAAHAHVAKLTTSSQKHPLLRHLDKKPRYGMTLGMADILSSRKILLLISGKHKRATLKRLLKPCITSRFPASFLWLHPDVSVFCDQDAAGAKI
jgi:galactosamine-6-phosphate isomerase